MPISRLNGWQRIGVVLSILWALAVSALGTLEYANNGEPTHYFVDTIKIPVPHSKSATPAGVMSFEEFVGYRAEFQFSWGRFIAALFIPVVFFWLVAYIGVHVLRWVAVGFRPQTTSAESAHVPASPIKPRWYEGKRNLIGIVVLSLFLYLYVGMTTLAGATLRGNEALYIAAWTAVVFFVLWKQRNWKGWLGAIIGFVAGIALVFVASVASALFR